MTDTQVTSSNSKAAVVSASSLSELLRAFSTALTRLALYPAKHPNAVIAIEGAVEAIGQVTHTHGSVELIVGPDYLEYEGEHVPSDKTLTSLADRLHGIDIASIRFEPGLDLSQLQSALELLQSAQADQLGGQSLIDKFVEAGITGLVLTPIDYNRLVFAAGSSGEVPTQDTESIWRGFSASVLNPDGDSGLTPQQMTELTMAQAMQSRDDGGAQFRLQVQGLLQQMRDMDDVDAAEAFKRLGSFATSLDQNLQDQLLSIFNDAQSVTPHLDGSSIATEASDILESLRSLDDQSGRAPNETLLLFKRLVQFAPTEGAAPGAASLNLDLEPDEIDGSRIAGKATELTELFQKGNDADYSPSDYQEVLAASAGGVAPVEMVSIQNAYLNPHDSAVVVEQACRMAVHLAIRHAQSEQCPSGPFLFLNGQIETLLQRKHFDLLAQASGAAMEYAEIHGRRAKRGARKFLKTLRQQDTIENLLAPFFADDQHTDDLVSILRVGGGHAIAAAFAYSNEPGFEERRAALEAWVKTSDPEALAEAVELMAEAGWWQVQSLLDVIGVLEGEGLIEILSLLFENADPCIRFEAFSLAESTCPIWPEQALLLALAENDDRVGAMVLDRLERQEDEAAERILADEIGRQMESASPVLLNLTRGAAILADRGERGLTLLCQTLQATTPSLSPEQEKIAAALSESLSDYADQPEVQAALKHVHYAPSRLIQMIKRRKPTNP